MSPGSPSALPCSTQQTTEQRYNDEVCTATAWEHPADPAEDLHRADVDNNSSITGNHDERTLDGIFPSSRAQCNTEEGSSSRVPRLAAQPLPRSTVPPVLAWSVRQAELNYHMGVSPLSVRPNASSRASKGYQQQRPSRSPPLLLSPPGSQRVYYLNSSLDRRRRSGSAVSIGGGGNYERPEFDTQRRHFPDTDDEDDGPRYEYHQVSNPSRCSAPAVFYNSQQRLPAPSPEPIRLPPIMPSVTDRVTIDLAFFMHLVDTYSNSGDYFKRMRLCSMMQLMIDEFEPPSPSTRNGRPLPSDDAADVKAPGETRHSLKCLPFGSFTYNLHLPWASDLDFVLLPGSARYRRLLTPWVSVGGEYQHGEASHYANSYQSESSGGVIVDESTSVGSIDDHVKAAAECVKLLELVSEYLTQCAPAGTIVAPPVVITSSRIPLITLTCRDPSLDQLYQQWCGTCSMGLNAQCSLHSPVQVQISLSGAYHTGLETSAYIAMMNQHFGCLRPLVLFVKHVLLCEGLISPYNGGISSYTLVLMVVSFLNQFYSADGWVGAPLGQLLLGFLMWYGGPDDTSEDDHDSVYRDLVKEHHTIVLPNGLTLTSFDASQLIIRPLSSSDNTFNFTSRESADEEELFDAFKMDMLVILDPLSPNGEHVNLGKSAWRWPSVTAALRFARNGLISGSWWGQKYGISVPTVWIAARRAGHSGAHNDINTAAVGEESNASATGTTRSSVGAIGLCRDVDDDVDDEEGTTMRSSTSRAETYCN